MSRTKRPWKRRLPSIKQAGDGTKGLALWMPTPLGVYLSIAIHWLRQRR